MDTRRLEQAPDGQHKAFSVLEQVHVYLHAPESTTSLASGVKRPILIPRKASDALQEKGFEVDIYGTVRFSENSLTHPRRWPLLRKIYNSALICFLEFFMTLVSNTGSSIAPVAAAELGVSKEMALVYFTTIYLAGQAIGSLLFPPLAESFGGRTIYLTSTAGFAVFCLLIAVWPILPVVVVCRFFTGLFSAMPAVVAAGSIENMWDMTSRTFVIHIWIASAVVGLSFGPPVATFVSLSPFGWRLVFSIAAATTAFLAILCFGMKESRPSKVLRQHVKAVAKLTEFDGLSLDGDDSMPTFGAFLKTSLFLPLRLFFTEPIVLLTSTMAATVYGIIYLFSECLNIVYVEDYGFHSRQTSLVLLAVAVGVVLSFLPRLYDIRAARSCRRRRIPMEPEHKLFGFYVAAPVLAVRLWWFSCTVPPLTNISPWASIASLVLIGFSVVEFDNVLSGYLCDTYASYAASAGAGMSFLRCVLSGGFPLFGQQMFRNLGSNIALFILAAVATAYCGVAILFGLYGKQIRERSPFAENTWNATLSDEKIVADEISISEPQECVLVKA